MPCNDSSSSISIRLDQNDRFLSFDFAKITCGREISAHTQLEDYCQGRLLEDILELDFSQTAKALDLKDEEQQFILFMEWDALRSAIAQYLGRTIEGVDSERCKISSITHDQNGIEINQVILPPKELPAILPCHYSNN